jgi:hypothetical protein
VTTATQALAAVKTRLSGGSFTFSFYWLGDDPPVLPDTPTTFAFVIFNNDGSGFGPTAYGGGQGANLYRNQATIDAFVFSPPTGADGMGPVMTHAESIAARLRSFRDDNISVDAADVEPIGHGSNISVPGLESEVNNYLCAVARVKVHFDQIG